MIRLKDLLNEASKSKTNAEELKRVEDLLSQAHKDNAHSVMSEYEYRISMLKLLTQLEKKYGKKLPVFEFKMTVLDYIKKYFPGFKGNFGPYNKKWSLLVTHIESALNKK
jgi:hypothetical protein